MSTTQAFRWIVNAKEGATQANFIEDFEPIGSRLLAALIVDGYIIFEGERIVFTAKGRDVVGELR